MAVLREAAQQLVGARVGLVPPPQLVLGQDQADGGGLVGAQLGVASEIALSKIALAGLGQVLQQVSISDWRRLGPLWNDPDAIAPQNDSRADLIREGIEQIADSRGLQL